MKKALVLLTAVLTGAMTANSSAQNAGELDPNFGEGGLVISGPISTTSMDNAQCVAIRPTGEIVFAGVSGGASSFAMTIGQLLSDGTLDVSFGTDGCTTDAGTGGSNFAYDVVLQDDGHALVCGAVSITPANTAFAVWRVQADGSLDPNFGENGLLVVDLDEGQDYARDFIVHGDQITAVGASQQPGTNYYRAGMIRFDNTGTLDVGFATDGIQIYPATTTANYDMRAGTVGAEGDMYLVGYTTASSTTYPVVAHFDADGNADMDYGIGGFFNTAVEGRYFDAAFHNGTLYAVGEGNNGYDGVVRAHVAAGALDAGFGQGGTATVSPGGANSLLAVTVQADGKIVVGGSAASGFMIRDFLLGRLLVDGTLDPDFGSGGTTVTVVGPGFEDINDLAIQSDGLIVAAGFGQFANNEFVFARYGSGELGAVLGCTDPMACNYNELATEDDASCYGEGDPCDDGLEETVDDQYNANCECVGTITHVADLIGHAFRVYPNPVNEALNLQFEVPSANRIVQLVDVTGRVVRSSNATGLFVQWQVADCAAGTYALLVEDGNGTSVKRVMIR